MSMKKEIEYSVGKCERFSDDGQGIVVINGRKTFVPSLLIDDEAEIEILYRKKDFDVGRIHKLIKKSPYRIEPKCKCSTSCGGCCFQNLDYKKELEFKAEFSKNIINRVGGFNFKDIPILGMDEPYYYRNKIQVPFGYDKQDRLVYGFYKFKSHDIVPINECVIEDKSHVEILKNIKSLMLSMKIDAYDEDLDRGEIRHILLRVGKVSKEIMVVLVTRHKTFRSKNNFVKELVKLNKEITTVVQNVNERVTNVILGDYEETLYGPGFIYDSLLGVKFKISSKSFYQVNHDQCEKLYGIALRSAELKKCDTVLDAYCGIGTIGLIASKYCKEVMGVEIVKEAIMDAKINAKINNITNAKFICDDASNFVFNNKFDCVFADPPRKGLDDKFLHALLVKKPKKVVYISCDVSTLARDLKQFNRFYEIKSIQFVDMFPRTFHVETIVLLEKKKN